MNLIVFDCQEISAFTSVKTHSTHLKSQRYLTDLPLESELQASKSKFNLPHHILQITTDTHIQRPGWRLLTQTDKCGIVN